MKRSAIDSNWPLVTIGHCVKNCERTVGKAIRSIINIDYPRDKIEIIAVYGPSEDRTLTEVNRLLKKMKSIRWKLLNDKRRGLGYARQLVVDNATGEHIVWIDGDVEAHRSLVKEQVKVMESDPSIGASFCPTIHRGTNLVSKLEAYQVLIPDMIKIEARRIAKYVSMPAGFEGTICRAKAARDVGFNPLLSSGDDVDFFIRMKLGKWKFVRNERTFVHHYRRDSWRSLWKESIWFGYGRYDIGMKYLSAIGGIKARYVILNSIEPLEVAFKAFKLTRDPACILLPVHYLFRRAGFLAGYLMRKRTLGKNRLS